MRHGRKINHLNRKSPHRKATLASMATALILNKRIETTISKAKALKKYVEPLLTKSKEDTMHNRRTIFSYLQDKESLKVLFGDITEKIATRPGGYTRIIRLGQRLGDAAEMCMLELVDFNEVYTTTDTKGKAATKAKTRRGRKATTKPKAENSTPDATTTPEDTKE